jgi:hypothetical protein
MKGTLAALGLAIAAGPGCADSASDPPDENVPPSDEEGIGDWIDTGLYLDWSCEPDPGPATGVSPHGTRRICHSPLVEGDRDGTGQWPVGATLVKEQYDGAGALGAISLETRVNGQAGDPGWLYWRRAGDTVSNYGVGEPFCTGCHAGAPRDYIFVLAP